MSWASMLRRNVLSGRLSVWAAMAAMAAMGWFYMVRMKANMAAMDSMAMPAASGLDTLFMTFLMWTVMMMAMMLPSTVPAVSVFMTVTGRRDADALRGRTALFIAGYIAVWIGYSAPAALAQWALTRAAVMTPMGENANTALGAAVLVTAGLFQFTPFKDACLSKCRAPIVFFMHAWRDGTWGAFAMGLRHGAYCVGCCWALMAVLFVVGTMNLLWMGLLTILVLAEKIIPPRCRFDRVLGVGLVLWGVVLGVDVT